MAKSTNAAQTKTAAKRARNIQSPRAKNAPAKSASRATHKPSHAAKTSSAKRPSKKTVVARAPTTVVQPKGKLATIIAALRKPSGASIDELMAITGWQAHSVRGAISGAIKKKLGLQVSSAKMGMVRTYRIATVAAA